MDVVVGEDFGDLAGEFLGGEGFVEGEAEGDGEDFDGEDADLVVMVLGRGVQFGEELDVGPEADADAVEEDDGEFVGGFVRAVPVA